MSNGLGWTNPLPAFAEADARRVRFDVSRPAPAALAALPAVNGLLAGAAEVDITPPPGMPKAGHSRNAQTGDGFRTRLRAHVLHLRAGTAALTLVQCDLLAGSAIVQQLVADAVADLDVPLAGLFVGATHTHAGPGQFHGNALMNRFSSNHPGFDPAFTAWLVDRIAGAVRAAVTSRRPARLAVGATEVWGLTRNRSLDAYLRNQDPGATADPQGKYAAVNPWLHLIRVDGVDGDPIAASVIFSIHGTGISHSDHAYNADVWAYLKGELGRHIQRTTGHRAVVGAVEGTHGDVAPAVRPGLLVYPEAVRVGSGIGAAAAELYDRLEGELAADVPLAAGFREIDLAGAPVAGGITLPRPAFGAATIAGAHENTTFLVHRIPPFRPGLPKPGARGPHGAKWIPGGRRAHDVLIPPETFPSVLPLQILRIGAAVVVGLPFEVTVESGRRVAAEVRSAFGAGATFAADVAHVAVSSLANEQFCYLTTPEEYSLQRYEGGNTLYGPQSQPFIAACAGQLARDLASRGSVSEPLPHRTFDFAARRYLARPTGAAIAPEALGSPGFVDATLTEDGYWEFRWRDAAPGDLTWHEPLVRVESAAGDGSWTTVADDQGYDLGVVHLGAGRGGAHRYAARWYTRYLGPVPRHRFAVATPGSELASTPFA
jgi:neutral ceramidase